MAFKFPAGQTNGVGLHVKRHSEPGLKPFFHWQESTAGAFWDLTLKGIPWPPQSPQELWDLVRKGFSWMGTNPLAHLKPGLLADAIRPIAAHLRNARDALRLFIDAQLLISAQTTSERANALYAASALDLPQRGAVHLMGGMGAISSRLAQAVEEHGGQVLYRKRVKKVALDGTKPPTIEFQRGDPSMAEMVIFNLPPWNIVKLLEPSLPRALKKLPPKPEHVWGAFMVYLGVEGTLIPEGFPLHHQIILGRPLAEGNSIFLSINPAWDTQRAPQGKRAITISTHTDLWPWWQLHNHDKAGYHRQRKQLQEKILGTVEGILPRISTAAELILDGTPVTFERFTGRAFGWVSGFPQVDLFQGKAPRLAKDLWMVGDSISPGQSTTAVASGGLRVAAGVLTHLPRNGN
jgi:phytoene dehydrogenase-like protein